LIAESHCQVSHGELVAVIVTSKNYLAILTHFLVERFLIFGIFYLSLLAFSGLVNLV